MVTLKKSTALRGEDPLPLTWRMVWANRAEGKKSAIITCANGHDGVLQHTITADGTVSPSCVCTAEGCDWHEWVRLENWEP